MVIKTHFKSLLHSVFISFFGAFLLNACDTGTNNNDSGDAYVTVSMAIPAANSTANNVSIQQINASSIIITVSDGKGFTASGDIVKSGGNLTLSVKPYTPLTVSGIAYEGGVATHEGEQSLKALRPGEVANINFNLTPINPPAKPVPVVTPANGAVGVPLNTMFTANLDFLGQQITVDSASLTLTSSNGATIATSYTAPDGGLTLSFNQLNGSTLDLSTEYSASLEVNYTDNTGAPKTFSYPWAFTSTVFADPDLASCVYDSMQTNGWQSYANVTDLTCAGTNYNYYVHDLHGIENLPNLHSLDVSMNCDCSTNFVTDISPLSGLTNLVTLDLSYNLDITKLGSVTGLTNVQSLNLAGNGITDITPWTGLTNLVSLDLSSNNISDVSSLANLTKLQNLNLRYNSISDISPLSTLTALQSLDVSYNSVSNTSPLTGLATLRNLNLSSNNINDITPLTTLVDLQTLDLSRNSISDVSTMNKMTGLVEVHFGYNNISTVSLAGLPNLTTLEFYDNRITTFSISGGIPNLQNLNLSLNYITEFTLGGVAADYPSLNTVTLSYNNIKNISDLQKLTKLRYLQLDNNNVEDVSPLSTMTGLTWVILDNNNVQTGVSSLSTLANVSRLSLNDNPSLPCADINTLDQTFDNSDGSGVGKIIWNTCFDVSNPPLIADLSFTDGRLSRCVNLAATSGELTYANELTSLSCPSAGITNLTGIDQLVNLQALDLSGNSITNFAKFSSLRNLTSAVLSNTGLSYVGVFASLKNLQNLNLDSNPLTSVGDFSTLYYSNYIGGLTNLTSLSFQSNKISNSLQGLTTLFKAQSIDLTCSPAALESEIVALDKAMDNTPDGQDGSTTGVVTWTLCP